MSRISVLMGIYNCAPTLQEALDSLYAQTYQDFKIILCDDGSKDDTLKIAEENARRHDNVIVIELYAQSLSGVCRYRVCSSYGW